MTPEEQREFATEYLRGWYSDRPFVRIAEFQPAVGQANIAVSSVGVSYEGPYQDGWDFSVHVCFAIDESRSEEVLQLLLETQLQRIAVTAKPQIVGIPAA